MRRLVGPVAFLVPVLAAATFIVAGVIEDAPSAWPSSPRSSSTSSRPPSAVPSSKPAEIPEGTYRQVTGEQLLELVDQVDVAERVDVDGYDRDCGTGHACSFGPAWTDDVDVAGGHNGCGTRDDVLTRDLVDRTYRPNTRECVVVTGTLFDPYTGTVIAFTKEAAQEVGVDHVYPLALAWDMGAASWPEERRRDFANDPRNLLAVSGRANSSKSDSSPGEWLPINAGYRCTYVAQFLEIASAYGLPVTAADIATARDLAPSCR